MAKDYKKDDRVLYLPGKKPVLIDVPELQFLAVGGQGDPNEPNGAYQEALGILYSLQYTIKMSKMGSRQLPGYFDYVVPPLEGFWQLSTDDESFFSGDKSKFRWLSAIRLPEFVNQEIFDWACKEATDKKGLDTSKAKFLTIKEGLCVQVMHIGPYDSEPETLAKMDEFIAANGLIKDLSEKRRHHEIYLSDPRRAKPDNLRTVLRVPVKKLNE